MYNHLSRYKTSASIFTKNIERERDQVQPEFNIQENSYPTANLTKS